MTWHCGSQLSCHIVLDVLSRWRFPIARRRGPVVEMRWALRNVPLELCDSALHASSLDVRISSRASDLAISAVWDVSMVDETDPSHMEHVLTTANRADCIFSAVR